MTRTVNGERLFDVAAKEVLRKQLWQVADYCGVQILTYAILANHFHVLVRVPLKTGLPDSELLRRYAVLYPKPTRYQAARLDVIRQQLAVNGREGVAWRKRQLALMGDISQFMKLVKQRFSVWFNKSHDRFGTLWAERFKSVLAEPDGRVLRTMAAYVDLNCVRAGLALDPKDYRFCGYAEAVAGSSLSQRGLMSVFNTASWPETQAGYRQILFGTTARPQEARGRVSDEEIKKVLEAGGKLPLATVLRCRVRYFTDGAVLGHRAFVARHLAVYRRRAGKYRNLSPYALPSLADWAGLTTLRKPRRSGFR